MGPRLRRAGNVIRHTVANPRSFAAYRQGRARARERTAAFSDPSTEAYSLRQAADALVDERAAVIAATGASTDDYDRVLRNAWSPSPEAADTTSWETRSMLLRILTAVANLATPETAVEIGVERGFSSSVILNAMQGVGRGHLYSIDLPSVEADRPNFTGHVIPDHLRQRWSLTVGPSQRELPKLLQHVTGIDLFLHDGDHSYESQMQDLECVWPHLTEGGIIVIDDVWSAALYDFATSQSQQPYLVERYDEHDGIGLLVKRRG